MNFVASNLLKKGQKRQIACIRVTELTTSIDGSVQSVLMISKNHLVGQLDFKRPLNNDSCRIPLDVYSDGLQLSLRSMSRGTSASSLEW